MGLKLITAPPAEPITLAEAYVQCQVDTTTTGSPPVTTSDHDAFLTATIPVIRQQVEQELSRALIQQTWELSMDEFPQPLLDDYARDGSWQPGWPGLRRYPKRHDWRAITIPMPPLQSVTSITYIDTAGMLQTLDHATYIVDDTVTPATIVPTVNNCWPSVLCQPNAVKVRFVCGYAPHTTGSPPTVDDYARNIPAGIKHWMLLMLANWFRNREATWQQVSSQTAQAMPYVDSLIFPYRVFNI